MSHIIKKFLVAKKKKKKKSSSHIKKEKKAIIVTMSWVYIAYTKAKYMKTMRKRWEGKIRNILL